MKDNRILTANLSSCIFPEVQRYLFIFNLSKNGENQIFVYLESVHKAVVVKSNNKINSVI